MIAILIALPLGAVVAFGFRRLIGLTARLDRSGASAPSGWDRAQFSMMAGAVAGVAFGMALTGAGPLAGLWLGGAVGVHLGVLPPLEDRGSSWTVQNLLFGGTAFLGTAVGVVFGTF